MSLQWRWNISPEKSKPNKLAKMVMASRQSNICGLQQWWHWSSDDELKIGRSASFQLRSSRDPAFHLPKRLFRRKKLIEYAVAFDLYEVLKIFNTISQQSSSSSLVRNVSISDQKKFFLKWWFYIENEQIQNWKCSCGLISFDLK